jgi:hypothetical protein
MKKFLLSCFVAIGIGANAQITLGGTTTTQGQPVPIDNNYGYSYVQQIFLKSEIKADVAGNITGLRFYLPTAAVLTNSSSWTVYLGHTTKTTFSTTADWIPVSSSALTQVFSGTVSNASGIVEVTLPTPFAYNNTDNLVVAVDENTANFDASANRFYSYAGVANSTLYYRSDTVNPDPTAITAITGTRSAQKSKITFLGLTSSAADCPVVSAPAAGATAQSLTPTITWAAANAATGYKISVGTTPGATNILNNVDLGNVTTYTFSSGVLSPSKRYYYTINSYNATITNTGCAERNFSTACAPVAVPYTENFESLTVPAAPVCTVFQNAGTGNNWASYNFAEATFGFSAGNTLRYAYNGTNAGNAWFYTVGLALTGGTTYQLTFRSGSSNADYTEKLKVAYGTSAVNTAMTNILADYPDVDHATSSIKTISFTPATTGTYYIGFNAYSAADQAYLYLDDIAVALPPTAVPNCTTVSTPTSGATGVSPTPTTFNWATAATASGYKVYVGTTAGNYNVVNGTSVATTTFSTNLSPYTTYYAKVVPYNVAGDATGCAEFSFTTGIYCAGSGTVDGNTGLAITNVTLNTLNNTSVRTAYTDYTGNVTPTELRLSTSYTVSITNGSATGYYTDDIAYVWIDYNHDGTFSDTTERTTVPVAANINTASIAIPATATLGVTRMRVKYTNAAGANYNTACGIATYGEVEDYAVEIKETLAVSDVNKAGISVYPNPFTDVLKISDVKGVKSVSVSDMSGREVKSLAPSAELNLSNLKTGLYIINLKMEDGSVKSFKAIKK